MGQRILESLIRPKKLLLFGDVWCYYPATSRVLNVLPRLRFLSDIRKGLTATSESSQEKLSRLDPNPDYSLGREPMQRARSFHFVFLLFSLAVFCAATAIASPAQTFTALHSFD